MAMSIIMNIESVDLDKYVAAEKKIQLMLTTKDLVDWREEFLLDILKYYAIEPWVLLAVFGFISFLVFCLLYIFIFLKT